MSVLPSKLVKELTTALERERDPHTATAMRAYMRNQFEFLGIKSPQRRAIQKAVVEAVGYSSDVLRTAELLWKKREREFQYAACELLITVAKSKRARALLEPIPNSISRIQQLIVTKSWWDTVDALSPRVAFHLLTSLGVDALRTTALKWGSSSNMWLQRSAIILQLGARQHADFALLSELILQHASSTEFFIRKGAGWALREYSKYEPKRVRDFVSKNKALLSGLTVREAMKYC